MTTFPLWLDNSALDTFRSCEKKFEYSTIMDLEPTPKSIHLHAGSAFARGLEIARKSFFVEGLDAETSIARGLKALWKSYGTFETPDDSAKTWDRLSVALVHYFDTWKLGEDYVEPILIGEDRAIEFSFAIPLKINHPETGEPILYTGKPDCIGRFRETLFCLDEKTTKGIGPRWADQWPLRAQFMGYTWAAREYGYPVAGTMIRGVAVLKTEIKHAESVIYHTDLLLDKWMETTYYNIERAIEAWRRGKYHFNFGHACSAYDGCPFRRLCESPDPSRWMMYYGKRNWDPLHRPDAS